MMDNGAAALYFSHFRLLLTPPVRHALVSQRGLGRAQRYEQEAVLLRYEARKMEKAKTDVEKRLEPIKQRMREPRV